MEDLRGPRFVEAFPFLTDAEIGIPATPVGDLRGVDVPQILARRQAAAVTSRTSKLKLVSRDPAGLTRDQAAISRDQTEITRDWTEITEISV